MIKMKRYLLLVIGVISLALGTIGMILPLIPTTPFFLLATACFLRSSDRLYKLVSNHPIIGDYIINYQNKTMKKKDKIRTLIFLWIGITISMIFIDKLIVYIMLICIASCVTIHISTLKSI